MNAALRLITFMLFTISLLILAPVAQSLATSPEFVSFTGSLHSPGGKGVLGPNTFMVSIQGKEWIFDVEKARNLQGNELGLEILQNIFPSTLRFIGPKKLLISLEKPEVTSKLLTIEGYIYVPYNMLQVTAIGTGSRCLQVSVYKGIRTICPAG